MAVNTTPVFTKAPELGLVSIATANANLDGTGTIGTLYTAGADGAWVERVSMKAIVTTTAGMLRFYVYDGTNYFLIHEETVAAITKSATVPAWEAEWLCRIKLQATYSLRVSTEKAETFKITAHAESLTG